MSKNGWPSIDPGDLRHSIVIQQQAASNPPSYDAAGSVSTWTTFTTTWAAIEPMRGTDVIRGGQDVSKLPLTITIRFQPGILPSMRVQARDYAEGSNALDYYIIQSIEDVDKRGVLLRLTCLGLGANQ